MPTPAPAAQRITGDKIAGKYLARITAGALTSPDMHSLAHAYIFSNRQRAELPADKISYWFAHNDCLHRSYYKAGPI
jgi:hypothetical protein